MRSNYKQLGQFIEVVNIRNTDLKGEMLLGVSINKILIPSIANTVGTDMSTYKLIKRNQFAYGPVTSRNSDQISVAQLFEYENAIVSQSYVVFEVIDTKELEPEYLMMWFKRPEFDRYARFKSHGSTRETFDWNEMCEAELPIPSIEKQREIVEEYNTIVNRIKLNEKLNQKIEETAQALYKHWFVDFEFPNENGQPYRSSGGKLVYNEEFDQEIPEGWEVKDLVDLATIEGGKRMPKGYLLVSTKNPHPYIKVTDMGNNKFVMLTHKFEYVPSEVQKAISRYTVNTGDLIISTVGSIGIVKIIEESLDSANLTENCNKVTNINGVSSDYLYHFLYSKTGREEIRMRDVGAVQAKLPMYNIESLPILCPEDRIHEIYTIVMNSINNLQKNYQKENIHLLEVKNLMLSRISKVESLKTEQAI
ncbi:restriction endonuclease subunit S [Candidatus Thioglobus sp.]|nr:restriction endonuclease subunit S [Candidatus Thioglobus sp.]